MYPPRRLAIRPARLAGWGERELGQADRSGGVDLARTETSQLDREMGERKTQDPDYIYKKRIGLAVCGVVGETRGRRASARAWPRRQPCEEIGEREGLSTLSGLYNQSCKP